MDDIHYIKEALKQAQKAAERNEVPVGAIVVCEGKIIARAGNRRIEAADATAHAEILAIKKACKKLGTWRLDQCELYVTLEPCAMCAGALVNARIKRLIFGAYDKRFGCAGSVMSIPDDDRLNHRMQITSGVLESDCAQILSDFFAKKRKN